MAEEAPFFETKEDEEDDKRGEGKFCQRKTKRDERDERDRRDNKTEKLGEEEKAVASNCRIEASSKVGYNDEQTVVIKMTQLMLQIRQNEDGDRAVRKKMNG